MIKVFFSCSWSALCLLCMQENLYRFASCSSVISLTCSSPPPLAIPPSGQEKLLCLPEGLLSNTRLPRHYGLMCLCVCQCVCVPTVLHQPAQLCCSGIWQFYSTLSFGKHTLGWECAHRARRLCFCVHTDVSVYVCDTVSLGIHSPMEKSWNFFNSWDFIQRKGHGREQVAGKFKE